MDSETQRVQSVVRDGNFGEGLLLIQRPWKSVSNTTGCNILCRGLGSIKTRSGEEKYRHLEAIPAMVLQGYRVSSTLS